LYIKCSDFFPFKNIVKDRYLKINGNLKFLLLNLNVLFRSILGMETDSAYEQKLMPDGKLNIDGILCCFDVSNVTDRSLEKQVEFCSTLLVNAMKTKKPVVLVTTKNDNLHFDYVREAEKLLTKKEFKNSIPIVETSAQDNVNVESAFLLLAHMMDKSKTRAKVAPFVEANKARREILEVAQEAYKNLLRNKITDSKTNWAVARKRLEKESDYQHYVDLFGSDKARLLVRKHTRYLREELVRMRQKVFMEQLPKLLTHFLPDLEAIGDR